MATGMSTSNFCIVSRPSLTLAVSPAQGNPQPLPCAAFTVNPSKGWPRAGRGPATCVSGCFSSTQRETHRAGAQLVSVERLLRE